MSSSKKYVWEISTFKKGVLSPHVRFEANIADLEADLLKSNSESRGKLALFTSKQIRNFSMRNEREMERVDGKRI
jgi:hypothetical protein